MEVKKEHETGSTSGSQHETTMSTAAAAVTSLSASFCNNNHSSNGSPAGGSKQESGREKAGEGRMPAPSLKRPREVQDWLLHPPDGSVSVFANFVRKINTCTCGNVRRNVYFGS